MEDKKTTMKKIFFFLFCLVICSCNFDKKIPEKENLLNERLQEIDWSEITRYPSVSSCDSLMDKTAQKKCFFDYLTKSLQERLSVDTLSILYPEVDTIDIKVTVNPDATLVFEPQFNKQIAYGNQKIDSVIKTRLQGFPQVEPAQKEGIPVKTEFVIQVILEVE